MTQNSYLDIGEISRLGLLRYGKNLKISRLASLYRPWSISLGDNVRIDDFCVINGAVEVDHHCHFAPHCIVSGSDTSRIVVDSCCTFAYGVKIFSQSDDYSGHNMTGSVVPRAFTHPTSLDIHISRHTIVGASTVIMPGVTISEGVAVGALSLVKTDLNAWSIYAGIPAKCISPRSQNLLRHSLNL